MYSTRIQRKIKRGDNFNITRGSSSYFWSNYAPISPDVFSVKATIRVYTANPRLHHQIHHENDFSRPFSVTYRWDHVIERVIEPHLVPRVRRKRDI